MANGDTKTESYLRVAAEGTRADLPTDTCCNTKTQDLILGVANRIMDVEDEVEELKNNPDVVDIVDTYQDLQDYDTSTLTDKDVIRVLADEQHDGQSTYYRWDEQSSAWTYIGAAGDYYTKEQVDDLLDDKQDVLTAGANITIDANNEISATDTTYTHFTGATASTDGTQGLVPGPLAGDEGKFLKADGTWAATGGGGDSVYSTKTTSNQSDGGAVFIGPLNASQTPLVDPTTTDNHYRYFWAMPFDVGGQDNFGIPGNETINIGGKQNDLSHNTTVGYRTKVLSGDSNTVLGYQSEARGFSSNVVIGDSATSAAGSAVVIGKQAQTSFNGTVALGSYSQPTRMGEVNVGTSQSGYGYNNTNYRVIGGVHDGVNAHDVMTVGQANALIDAINTALGSSIPHIGS